MAESNKAFFRFCSFTILTFFSFFSDRLTVHAKHSRSLAMTDKHCVFPVKKLHNKKRTNIFCFGPVEVKCLSQSRGNSVSFLHSKFNGTFVWCTVCLVLIYVTETHLNAFNPWKLRGTLLSLTFCRVPSFHTVLQYQTQVDIPVLCSPIYTSL